MPAKVRVYELAREMGLSNKEVIDLCGALGIGVKSHSSSIVEAQADRVRRKADREGLIKEPEPAEAETEVEEAPKKVVSTKKAPRKAAEPVSAKVAPPPSDAPARVVSSAGAKPSDAVSSRPIPPPPPAIRPVDPVVRRAPAPAQPPPAEQRPAAEAPAPVAEVPTPVPVVPSQAEVPAAATQVAATASPAAPAPAPEAPKVEAGRAPVPPGDVPAAPDSTKVADQAAATAASSATGAAPALPGAPGVPKSNRSGKPIPPPPGPPRSRGGKPIPPPPGMGPRSRPAGGGGSPGGSGRPGGGFRSGPPSGGGPSAGRGPSPSGPPGRGGPANRGGPPGRGGPANRGRPRRKSRRRRSLEELTPMDVPTYSAEDAPVPEGMLVLERASTAQDLGPRLNRTAADVVRFLLTNGEMVTATQSLTDEMIEMFAADIGAEIRLVDPGEEQEVELQKLLEFDDGETMAGWPVRPPVITVMGHVDHGKTLLLDRIRSTNVVEGEAGGITQHIGAYKIDRSGKSITFLDTPGHEAFTAMRARGADATDIVVLVVAADDGVMPQTLEALDHARAAEVPIVVAINKMDREGADPQRVMTQLAERELIPEEWGGDTIMVPVSAMTGDGIDDLIDNLLIVAEVEDLRATPDDRAAGTVLEAHLDIGRGPVATILVERGTLSVGDPLVSGAAWGRVRALINDRGENIKSAGPSTPAQVLGLNDVAEAGDGFVIAPNEKVAAKVAATREHWHRLASLGRDASATSGGAKLEDIFKQIQAGEAATLNLIIKADVNGSLEAVSDSLKKLERDDVKLAFVLRGVGGVTENDVQLAAASNATILGFNVRPDRKARELAEQEKVEIRTYEIIYKLLEDIENAMLGLLEPETEEIVTGEAEVREIFRIPRLGAIAGCMVTNGVITRGSKVRFLREGTVIWNGSVQSLKRFKEDAREVATGFECGIGLSDFQDLKDGDIIETYEEREIPRT
ncbi:MAG: translation initiation factor IF-2 [Actinomycetia bacterium]|nr:translation initiation factor IF-2 [Actinomycetes bacterium]